MGSSYRLFFALKPPSPVAVEVWDRACRYRAARRLTGRPTPPERLHVSLNGLGNLPDLDWQVLSKARAAATRVRTAAFQVAFNRLESWTGARAPLVLRGDEGVAGVLTLHGELHDALSEVGLARGPAREIEPHLTLLRDPVATRGTWISPVGWQVREFMLIATPPDRSRHELLGLWPLQGCAARR